MDRDIGADRLLERGAQIGKLVVGQRLRRNHVGRRLAASGGNHVEEGADHRRQHEQPAIARQNAKEASGEVLESGFLGQGRQGAGLFLAGDHRRADQPPEIVGLVDQPGDLFQVGGDVIEKLFGLCQLEKRGRVSIGQSRGA